jgi:hypothetical protein
MFWCVSEEEEKQVRNREVCFKRGSEGVACDTVSKKLGGQQSPPGGKPCCQPKIQGFDHRLTLPANLQ